MFDELFPDARSASISHAAQRPYQPPEPGLWQGFGGAVAHALPYAANTTASAWAAVLEAYGHAAAYRDAGAMAAIHGEPAPDPEQLRRDTIDQMGNSEAARQFREQAKAYAPNPATVGLAGQITHGLVSGVAKMTAYAGAGPAGPLLFGADAGINRAQDLTDQGVDSGTAALGGLVTGTTAATMMRLPPALGATRAQSAAIGATVAPALTVAEVGSIRALLQHADYEKIAAQYQPFDPLNLSIAAITGGTFGALFHQGAPAGPRLTPDQHAALLATNEARTRDASTLVKPGDVAAANRAVDAQTLARQQMDTGEMVSVGHLVEPDPPTLEAARVMAFERMTAEARAELIADAGNCAEPGDVARITQERADIERRLDALRSDAAFREEAKAQQEQGLTRKEAESAARKTVAERIATLNDQAARLDQMLELNRRAARAEQDLALLDRGELPERFRQAVEGHAANIVRGFERTPIAQGVRDLFAQRLAPVEAPRVGTAGAGEGAAPLGIVEKVREMVAQAFGKAEPAPRPEATPATPEQARAKEIAARNPDATIRLEDGTDARMADMISHAQAVEAQAKTETAAFEAAINCALRFPQ